MLCEKFLKGRQKFGSTIPDKDFILFIFYFISLRFLSNLDYNASN
jgi:hypothetical protein